MKLYVCMYVYMYVCIYVCIDIYIYVCIVYVYRVCMCTYVCVYRVWVCMCIYTLMYVNLRYKAYRHKYCEYILETEPACTILLPDS